MLQHATFTRLNRAFNQTFIPGQLSLGLVIPLESYAIGARPSMHDDLQLIQQAEALGFAAIWLRDIPFDVPAFGDVGQMYDPFTYLGYLAGQTKRISLGIASIILPLRHPAHVAKAAASIDQLSDGRLLLGIASGDRPAEYPAMNQNFNERGQRFRDSYNYIRHMGSSKPQVDNAYGKLGPGMDLLPKPVAARLPLLVTGSSQQDRHWLAQHGDGWMTYPRSVREQQSMIKNYRNALAQQGEPDKPVMQSLYIDVLPQTQAPAQPIHLGIRSGMDALHEHLQSLQAIGVNHVALNLRFNQQPLPETLHYLGQELLPHFSPPARSA